MLRYHYVAQEDVNQKTLSKDFPLKILKAPGGQ